MTRKNNIIFALNERELMLSIDNIRDVYEKKISKLSENIGGVPGTRLKVCRRENSFQCFLTDIKTGKSKYASKSNPAVKKIAQADYNIKLLNILRKRSEILESVSREMAENSVASAYNVLSEGRKKLVLPADTDNEEYIERWKKEEYEHKPFISDDIVFMTARGLRVRSKSEIMIADELDKREIPYRYEYPVKIGGATFHPDFIILNKNTRREIIWEHFGLIDDSTYRDDSLKKIRLYENAGYLLGLNFVFTAETSRVPLSKIDIISVINRITE